MIKTVARITSVERRTTKTGKNFGVISDANGTEYTSWVDPLTIEAEHLQGKVVQIGFDEQTKGQYTNRTLRFLQETGDSGAEYAGSVSVPGGVPEHVYVPGAGGQVQTGSAEDASVAGANDDWLDVIRTVARRGEWRAAEALQRREDIARSVALNNTIQFFQYIQEGERSPSNIETVFEFMLKALNGV